MQSGYQFPIERSNLFILHKLEEKEIEKLKWIESEKAGQDIGRLRAEWMWFTNHRENWKRALRDSGIY
jgi:hypothetical protein